MAAEDVEERLVALIDGTIARVAEHGGNDRDCALLIAELEGIKQRAHSSRAERREPSAPGPDPDAER